MGGPWSGTCAVWRHGWLLPSCRSSSSLLVALVLGGCGTSAQGAVDRFQAARVAGDSAKLASLMTDSLRQQAGPAVVDTLPEQARGTWTVQVNGDRAVAKKSGEGWIAEITLVKDGGWKVDGVTSTTGATSEENYDAETSRTVEVKELPEGQTIPLGTRAPGKREVVTKTTTVNGVQQPGVSVPGKVIQEAVPETNLVGTGKTPGFSNLSPGFDGQTFSFQHTIAEKWLPTEQVYPYKAGDVFKSFIILPSTEIVADTAGWNWDGKWGTKFPGGPGSQGLREHVVAARRREVRSEKAKAEVKDGWPKGRYVMGVTVNKGTPVSYGYHDVQ